MKIVIVGPGAIGCLFGGLLARAGEEVVMLDHRPERARKLQQSGLRVKTGSENFTVPVTVKIDAKETGIADSVIVCVKAYDTVAAAKSVTSCVGKETIVLTLQNGLGNVEKLAEVFDKEHVLGGVTGHGAILMETGHVQHTGIGETVIGAMNLSESRNLRENKLAEIKAAFDAAGISTKITSNLNSALWGKVVLNCAINPLAALTRLRNGQLIQDPALVDLLGRVAEEAAQVAAVLGIVLPYSDPVDQVQKVCEQTAENINSMLADILKGRKTEIQEINGAVVREGIHIQLDAQLNKALVALVSGVEKAR